VHTVLVRKNVLSVPFFSIVNTENIPAQICRIIIIVMMVSQFEVVGFKVIRDASQLDKRTEKTSC
jgi:hypothetical protein